MKKFLLAGVLILSISLVAGCSSMSSILNNIEKAASKETAPVHIESADGVFSLEMPSSWEQPKAGTLNDVASLEAMNGAKEMYFMAIMEPKADFDMDLEGYRDVVVNYNQDAYGASFGDPVSTTVGGYDAYSYEFHVTSSDNINMYMRLSVIETDNYYGQLYTWTLKSMEDDNKATLTSIIETFKEVSAADAAVTAN